MKPTLEDHLMTVWGTVEDLKALVKAYGLEGEELEAFKGLALLHQARCEALWQCFEEGLKDNTGT